MTDDRSDDKKKQEEDGLSRRRFIKNTGMLAGGVVGGSLLGGLLTNQFQQDPETQTDKKETSSELQDARMFFSRDDFNVLQAATERIFPEDDNGPGAIGLGVPYFIDKQLASSWGVNGKDYRQGPFIQFNRVESMEGKETEEQPTNPPFLKRQPETDLQRHQSRLTRGDIFLTGLRKMNDISRNRHNQTFDKLDEDKQIAILEEFENGNVKLNGVAAENFFVLLRQTTLEGAYSDPLYGGNKNMAGWRMKEFPGPQASYANMIEKEEFVKMDPISLNDYQG
ncbi:gluconate 2-dehydrogenase subunit 3 family protein [Lentibacillus salinarum]|uniref:Gluconate 2-dehydrogenase subunit 3 family protein n=1 Tax=Lentibacillus salinarum TaxID=446820 RepID=A0ABW3ZNZ9_9BACI